MILLHMDSLIPKLSILVTLVGFIVGYGSVMVIDIAGFLGRTSSYWTETTIRIHKITKPMIWVGMGILILGQGLLFSQGMIDINDAWVRGIIIIIMIMNGVFLSWVISPILLAREAEGRARELLPRTLQIQITISFIISIACWWSMMFLFVRGL